MSISKTLILVAMLIIASFAVFYLYTGDFSAMNEPATTTNTTTDNTQPQFQDY